MTKIRENMKHISREDADKVNYLINICHDGQLGFEAASKAVQSDAALHAELMQYSLQRQEFGVDLRSALVQLGGEPEPERIIVAALHRGWMTFRQAVSGNDKFVVLTECERGEEAAVSAFRETNSADLLAPIGGLIHSQYQAILRVHGRIRALRDAARTAQ